MMPPMTPSPTSSAPTPPMGCPHCNKPLLISKPPMASLGAQDDGSDPDMAPKAAPTKPPMKKKNAANMPMDELKNVIKSQDK